jgi:hypothetical protein
VRCAGTLCLREVEVVGPQQEREQLLYVSCLLKPGQATAVDKDEVRTMVTSAPLYE